MPKKTAILTRHIIDAICTRIKAGSFEQVAVQSLDVSWDVYQEWLRRADLPRTWRVYRELKKAVLQARAQARLTAEMEVRKQDAKAWLLQGPGRDSASQEGWGAANKATAKKEANESAAKLLELCTVVLRALTPYPEARAAVAEALEGIGLAEQKATPGQQ